jgi:hypothetical protein
MNGVLKTRMLIGYTVCQLKICAIDARESKGSKMKKNLIRGILLCSTLACAVSLSAQTAGSVSAQTADDIVNKYLAAIGGKETISQLKSVSIESAVQIMGSDAPSTTIIVDGVGYKSETDFNGTKIVRCINDKGGWTVNPMAGSSDPTPMPDDEYNAGKDQIYAGGALYDYAARGGKVELLGKDGDAYKIKLTSKENVESTYSIDATTYLVKSVVTKGKMQGQDVDITTSFSDYRKTDLGYSVPYAMNLDFGGQFSMSVTVKNVELNKTIDPVIFAMPKAGTN